MIPLLGVAAFFPAWLFAVGWNLFDWSFVFPIPAPLSYAVRGIIVRTIIGVIYLIALYLIKPTRVSEMARVHLDEEPELVQQPGSADGRGVGLRQGRRND